MEMEKQLVVIGGGPAGMAAALAAAENGLDPSQILLLERDSRPGGILTQCIHAGFGLHYFGEELTGPQYAGRFLRRLQETEISCAVHAMALSLAEGPVVTFVSPEYGFCRCRAGAVILATGCRERTRGALSLPGTRPAGVYTAGCAQRYVNIEGFLPGKRIVILGSGDIGLIMARRLTLEGAKVLRVCEVMPHPGGLARNIAQCLDDFSIPLQLSHTVSEIRGKERVEGVVISAVDQNRRPIPGSEEYVPCDTLLLSVGLIPENELARGAGILLDPVTGGAEVSQHMQTSLPGVFACGNALQVHDLVDFVSREAETAGRAAAAYCRGERENRENSCRTEAGKGIRYVLPQRITRPLEEKELTLSFRVTSALRNTVISLQADGKELLRRRKPIVTPGEMQQITLRLPELAALQTASRLTIQIESGQDANGGKEHL